MIIQYKPPQVSRLLWKKTNKQTFAEVSLELFFFFFQSVPDERRSWLLGPDCCISDVQRMSLSAETKKDLPSSPLSSSNSSHLPIARELSSPPTVNVPARVRKKPKKHVTTVKVFGCAA